MKTKTPDKLFVEYVPIKEHKKLEGENKRLVVELNRVTKELEEAHRVIASVAKNLHNLRGKVNKL